MIVKSILSHPTGEPGVKVTDGQSPSSLVASNTYSIPITDIKYILSCLVLTYDTLVPTTGYPLLTLSPKRSRPRAALLTPGAGSEAYSREGPSETDGRSQCPQAEKCLPSQCLPSQCLLHQCHLRQCLPSQCLLRRCLLCQCLPSRCRQLPHPVPQHPRQSRARTDVYLKH